MRSAPFIPSDCLFPVPRISQGHSRDRFFQELYRLRHPNSKILHILYLRSAGKRCYINPRSLRGESAPGEPTTRRQSLRRFGVGGLLRRSQLAVKEPRVVATLGVTLRGRRPNRRDRDRWQSCHYLVAPRRDEAFGSPSKNVSRNKLMRRQPIVSNSCGVGQSLDWRQWREEWEIL